MKHHSEDRPFVIIESPYPVDGYMGEDYAKDCLFDSIMRGEAPISIPQLYSDILNPRIDYEREWCKRAGEAILRRADLVAVYTDRGISMPMRMGIEVAKSLNIEVQERTILDCPVSRPRRNLDF